MIIGITGGSGCGKTTALQLIADLGGLVIDCDKVYHRLLETDKSLLAAIGTRFPGTVREGRLDRKKLAATVFADEKALLDLNAITHRAVKDEVLRLLAEAPALAAIDAIGLFESGLDRLCDITVAITAEPEAQLSRLMVRDGISRQEALLRLNAQKDCAYFTALCDYHLHNAGTEEAFRQQCLTFFQEICIIK